MSNQKKSGKLKKVGYIALAIVIAVVIIGLNVWSYIKDSGFTERRTVAIKTEHFSVSQAQMSYYFYSQYQNTYNSLASYGIDPSVYGLTAGQSLKTQKSTFDQSKTWFQYFMESAMKSVEEQLALCEAAKAAGIELTEKDHKEIESVIDSLEETAKAQGYSLKNYIKANYGSVVSVSDVEKSLETEILATRYLESELKKVDVSDEAIKAIYDKDIDKYDTADYLTVTVDFNDIYEVLIKDKKADDKKDDDKTEAKAGDESDKADDKKEDDKKDEIDPEVKAQAIEIAKKYAKKFAESKGKYSYEKVLEQYYVDVLKMSEETAKKTISEGKHIVTGAHYKDGDEQLSWVFGKDDSKAEIKEGSVKTFTTKEKHEHKEGDDESALADIYTIVLVTRPRGTVEGIKAVDVRHILFTTEKYENDAEVKKVYEQWKKDGAKEADFEKLALEYSEDTGSKFDGGLYEGVAKDQMVKEFNDWIFDEARKNGDHGIVKTTYGWHIMYYVDGSEEWQATIKNELQTEKSESTIEDAAAKYKVTVDYDAINDINA